MNLQTGVVQGNEPVHSPSDPNPNTLDNLEANIIKELDNVNTGENDGVPQIPDTTDTSGQPAAAPAGQATTQEPAKPAEAGADNAKFQRVSQENSNLRKTLTKLGIDPDSDIAEQINSGLITFEDVVRMKTTPAQSFQQPQTQAQQPAPQVTLDQKLTNLTNILAAQKTKTEISADEYLKTQDHILGVVADLVQANQTLQQSSERTVNEQRLDKCVQAINDVFENEIKSIIPAEVSQVAKSAFLGLTDINNVDLVKQIGPDRAQTPEGYTHTAQQAAPNFKKLIQSVYQAGMKAATKNITTGNPNPNQPNTNVVPLTPGGGPVQPPPPDKNRFDLDNLDANVTNFLASTTQGRV